MIVASLSQLKKELANYSAEELRDVCIRLVKHKKENKELLHYLVFESEDEQSFIAAIKADIEEDMSVMNSANLYWAKKTIRKTLRTLNKHIRFSGQKQTEVELRLFFCQEIKNSQLPIERSQVLQNLYDRQISLIEKALSTLHEDLQFDYRTELNDLKV